MVPPALPPAGRRRRPLALVLVALAAIATGCGSPAGGAPRWNASGAAPSSSPSAAAPSATASAAAVESISLSATGDIVMGNAPSRLPANGGKDFFAGVEAALAADLVMGNLEEPPAG